MKLNKLIIYLLFTIALFSCKNNAKSIDEEQHITISGDYYKNEEAERLNKEGIEMSKSGNYDGGKSAFLKSLEIEPNNPTTLSNLGLNRFLVYDYDSAEKYYNESYKRSDSLYHTAAVNLGLTYYYKKEFNKGIEIMNYVIEHTTDKSVLPIAYVHRALNYLGNDECKKAQTDLHHLIDNFRGNENVDYHIIDLTEKIKNCL